MDNGQHKGWVKLYRDLFDTSAWLNSRAEHKVVFITLLGMVNHTEKTWEFKGKTFVCQANQTVTSLEAIRRKCGKGISLQNVRSALKRFEKLGFLTQQSSNDGSLISLCHSAGYVVQKNLSAELSNKRSTRASQTTNKRVTTNKNEKNDINLKELLAKSLKNGFNGKGF